MWPISRSVMWQLWAVRLNCRRFTSRQCCHQAVVVSAFLLLFCDRTSLLAHPLFHLNPWHIHKTLFFPPPLSVYLNISFFKMFPHLAIRVQFSMFFIHNSPVQFVLFIIRSCDKFIFRSEKSTSFTWEGQKYPGTVTVQSVNLSPLILNDLKICNVSMHFWLLTTRGGATSGQKLHTSANVSRSGGKYCFTFSLRTKPTKLFASFFSRCWSLKMTEKRFYFIFLRKCRQLPKGVGEGLSAAASQLEVLKRWHQKVALCLCCTCTLWLTLD